MTTTIKIKSSDFNTQFVKDFQEKYSNRDTEINISASKQSRLDEQLFWEIIAALDWTQEEDDDILNPAIKALAKYPIHYIYLFQDILSEKLYQLDAQKYGLNIEADSWENDKYFSVDNFLYVRCCVVANGKETFETILNNPDEMPEDLTFEPLLSLAAQAYELKTGKIFNYSGHFNFETYSNENGWVNQKEK
jgi:hypothetical protein